MLYKYWISIATHLYNEGEKEGKNRFVFAYSKEIREKDIVYLD